MMALTTLIFGVLCVLNIWTAVAKPTYRFVNIPVACACGVLCAYYLIKCMEVQ
jgi:hypothetical protein